MDTKKQVDEIECYLACFRGGFIPGLFHDDGKSRDAEEPTDKALQGLVGGFEAALTGLSKAAGWARHHDPTRCGPTIVDNIPCAGCLARLSIDKIHKLLKKEIDWHREIELDWSRERE